MPVIMPIAESAATAKAGQRKPRRIANALSRSIRKNRMKIAEPENSPRQNSSVNRSASIARVNRPADDQARAAIATRMRPVRCWCCSAVVTVSMPS
jgi:hypothetical protein